MRYTAAEIARQLDGEVIGDGSVVLTGFAPADLAQPGHLTFAENEKYFARAEVSAASAILVDGAFKSDVKVLIRVASARLAFARVLPLFFPEPAIKPGIHASAIIAESAQVDPTAWIGPHCVVGERARIGPRSCLEGGNYVGADCHLLEQVRLYPNVVLYPRTQVGRRVSIHAGTVVGSDGFGYVFDQGAHRKVPQVGNVMIGDDVEIGANVTIDCATLGSTVIGKGSKIDNLVQIAHNVVIGEHSILVSQVGIAGSTRLGSYVTLAGQVGIAGHLQIGNQVVVAAQGGVMNNIPDGEKWIGTPAKAHREQKREWVAVRKLPELRARVAELERQVDELKARSGPGA